MKYRLACAATICAAFQAACGGGSSGSAASPPVPVATATPSNAASSTFTVQANPTSIPLPSVSGYTGTLNLPGITGYGTVQMTVAVGTAPGNAAFARRRQSTSIAINLPLLYVSLVPQNNITLRGVPGFTVTVPAGVDLDGDNFYSGFQQGASWYAGGGPGTVSAGTVSVPQSTPIPQLDLTAGSATMFAIAGTGPSSIQIASSTPIVMASPVTSTISAKTFDGFGRPIVGAFRQPMTLSDSDLTSHSSLSAGSLTSDTSSVNLRYDGHGDSFVLTASEQGVSGQRNFVSALGTERLVPSSGPMIAGSDGNIWMQAGNGVAKVTPSGVATQYSDPNTTYHWHADNSIAEDASGNIWVDYSDAYYSRTGLDRFTHSGQLTNFPFTDSSMGGVSGMVRGPDGNVWFGSGKGVYRVDSSGTISSIAFVNGSATNLLIGPDGNVWFSVGQDVDRLTGAGVLTVFTLPQATTNAPYLTFCVGPDGNFWAPFAYRTLTLLKFSTSGAVVSSTPLTYTSAWAPAYFITNGAPFAGTANLAMDRNGNVYFPDTNTQGVYRFAPDGSQSSYCTYSGCTNISQSDPLYLLIGVDGQLYVGDYTAPPSGAGMEVPALSIVDPLQW